MATYKLKRKLFTQWDETDNLKRMKDSDILAEQKKKTPSFVPAITQTAAGAGVGATALGLTKGTSGLMKGGLTKAGGTAALKGLKSGGKWGALAGGLIAGGMALAKHNKEASANRFYNRRLEYAQRQAMRREKKDWKSNMTEREGYSY